MYASEEKGNYSKYSSIGKKSFFFCKGNERAYGKSQNHVYKSYSSKTSQSKVYFTSFCQEETGEN